MQINLLANTDLRSVEEFENLIVADRAGAIVRLSDVARVELGAEEADLVAKCNEAEGVYLGVWPLVGANEIEVARRLRDEMERIRPTLPKDIEMRLVWDGTMFMRDALKEITKTLSETIAIVGLVVFLFMGSIRTALVPLVAMPVSLIGAALVMFAFGFSLNLLTMLAIVLSVGLVVDDAIVVVENVERRAFGQVADWAALVGARELVGPIIAMTITLAAVYTPIGLQGGLTRLAVPRVCDHAGCRGRRLGHRRPYAFTGHELALRASTRQGRPADDACQSRLRTRAAGICLAARRRAADASGNRCRLPAGHGGGMAPLHVLADGARAWRTRAISASSSKPRPTPRWRPPTAITCGLLMPSGRFPKPISHGPSPRMGRLRGPGGQGLEKT